ncbi:MAG: NADH-quinone oxidoreductase subunit NuoH [Deltaproteobacteria bacterium]|nr:NADH-quinone oxidoreductase subunit NuoH [Deltaproteobacteria bacterium]
MFNQLFGNIWLVTLASGAVIMGFLTVNALFLVWLERKLSARFQRRLGPTEVGFAGTLQTLADAVKLLGKQLITPRNADKPLYHLAPVIVFMPVVVGVSLFPIDRQLMFVDLNVGLVLVFAFAGIGFIGIFMAGWGSNNKYALLGAMRAVAQNIAYEIPLILSALSVTLLARSMKLSAIVEAQSTLPYLLFQPLGAAIYLIGAVAETNRAPFDIPEAESELVAGFHSEYSGMRFAVFFLAEYSNMAIVSMVATTLFLGGYHGPWLPGYVWFFIKVYGLISLMMWFRWTFPRLRFDQLMSFAWTVLVPLSLANLMGTAVVLKVFRR